MRLHHIGIAVRSIENTLKRLTKMELSSVSEKSINDPIQKVNVCFLGQNPMIELVEPCGEETPIDNLLDKGISLYHLCFEVCDLENVKYKMTCDGFKVLSEPQPAEAFNGRKIAFLAHPVDRIIIELLERE